MKEEINILVIFLNNRKERQTKQNIHKINKQKTTFFFSPAEHILVGHSKTQQLLGFQANQVCSVFLKNLIGTQSPLAMWPFLITAM